VPNNSRDRFVSGTTKTSRDLHTIPSVTPLARRALFYVRLCMHITSPPSISDFGRNERCNTSVTTCHISFEQNSGENDWNRFREIGFAEVMVMVRCAQPSSGNAYSERRARYPRTNLITARSSYPSDCAIQIINLKTEQMCPIFYYPER